MAADQALALRDCLERGTRDLARRFFKAANRPIGDAWELSVGGDLALSRRQRAAICAGAPRQRLPSPLARTAEHDPTVAKALMAVIGMLERPPHVLRPAIATRVARGPDPGPGSRCSPTPRWSHQRLIRPGRQRAEIIHRDE
jgi:hypothetical protein